MKRYVGQGRDTLAALRDLVDKMERDNRDPDLSSFDVEQVRVGHGVVGVIVECSTYPPEGTS